MIYLVIHNYIKLIWKNREIHDLVKLNVHRANLQTISSYPVRFSKDVLFISLVSFAFSCLPTDFRKQDYFFWPEYILLFTELYTPCVKRPISKSMYHAHHKSCWKSMHHVSWLQNYSTNYSTWKQSYETKRNIVPIKLLITISNLQLKEISVQEDHNIHMYSLLCLVVLAVENSRKSLLLVTYRNQVFLYFYFQPNSKKEKRKYKIPTLFSLIWHEA